MFSRWMTFAVLAAVTLAGTCTGAAAGSAAGPASTGRTAPREPLAVTTGDAALAMERAHGAASRTRPASEVVPRVPPESFIEALVESTSADNIRATIERLQAFETRYVSTDSCLAAGRWIRDRFLEYGYSDTRMDTFRTWTWQDSATAVNVLAYKPGTSRPHEYVVLGGHYDSATVQNFDDPHAPAPGAEDNASGVACVLEAARILAAIETERSVIFACWSAEEEGLWGSRAFVGDAVAESTSVFVYLNVDCIGYSSPPLPDGVIYADSTAISVASWMCDVATSHTPYVFEPKVQPLGASDQNSFWEAGYSVIDSAIEPSSPYMHTTDDVIANLSIDLATAITALNVVATAAAAGIAGQDPNLPPDTELLPTCCTQHDVLSPSPRFEWRGVDLDGAVVSYEYSLTAESEDETWTSVAAERRHVSFAGLAPGSFTFRVRAVDDQGAPDPSPAYHAFVVTDTLRPVLTVDTNFLPRTLVFRGSSEAGADDRQPVYENELLIFRMDADVSAYCADHGAVAFSAGNPPGEWEWHAVPWEFTFRPARGDSVVYFAARDSDGAETTGRLELAPVEAPMDLLLLQIDDWFGGDVPEAVHDAFYGEILAGHEHDAWDPLDHIAEGYPWLPSMEELGRYRTVMWTVGPGFELLRSVQAESTYHYVEGFVRAGGNLIIEGLAPMTALAGRDKTTYDTTEPLPDFVVEHAGVDSMYNAGNASNPSYPTTYGWAFLGGKALQTSCFDDVPVDTLGKWQAEFVAHGGVPWCEVVRPVQGTRRVYLFDAFLNYTLQDRPCGTLTYPEDGTGMLAYFGFPFYYLQEGPAAHLVDALLAEMEDWREPARLVFCDHDASPGSVTLTWYLDPPDEPQGCYIERRDALSAGDTYVRLNQEAIVPGPGGRFTYRDAAVEPESEYSYRLIVVERSGEETRRGPWTVFVPGVQPRDALGLPVPNPARRSVAIHYTVGRDHCWIDVSVYDCAGRHVRTLKRGAASAGDHDTVWDGADESGRPAASGVYFIRARLADRSLHRKVVLIR